MTDNDKPEKDEKDTSPESPPKTETAKLDPDRPVLPNTPLAAGPGSDPVPQADTSKPAEPTKAELKEEAAAAGIQIPSKATKEEVKAESFFVGYWKKHKQYGCPYCQFRTLNGPKVVVRHIADTHIKTTVSSVLGPDGQPVVKVE